MKIVVLDGYTVNPGDLSWQPISDLGSVAIYDRTPTDLVISRSKGAEILLVNKTLITADVLAHLPKLRYIGVMATGYNNIDLAAAKLRGITVCNARNYSSESVAQHTFALLLSLCNAVAQHAQSVSRGDWQQCEDFSYFNQPLIALSGKTMGIIGFGNIGNKVADLAMAFGMTVIAQHPHPLRAARAGIRFVDLPTIFSHSDVVSLHCPLTAQNHSFVNKGYLSLMKKTAYLINTARGGLINETDLRAALLNRRIAGAALDVLSEEPPISGNTLIGLKNCLITPHQAWANNQSRRKLIKILHDNIVAFSVGSPQNVL